MLVKIGGLDETVPVHLVDEGVHHKCNATRGHGSWHRAFSESPSESMVEASGTETQLASGVNEVVRHPPV